MEHVVKVWEQQCRISVHQKSKSVWIAVGNYLGERVEVKGRSETQAVSAWREAAQYRGN
jgi:hypothetical protein